MRARSGSWPAPPANPREIRPRTGPPGPVRRWSRRRGSRGRVAGFEGSSPRPSASPSLDLERNAQPLGLGRWRRRVGRVDGERAYPDQLVALLEIGEPAGDAGGVSFGI